MKPRSEMGRLDGSLKEYANQFTLASVRGITSGASTENDLDWDKAHRQRRAILERVRKMIQKARRDGKRATP